MCSNVQTALTTLRLGSRFTSILNDSSVGFNARRGNTPDPAVRKRSAGFVLLPGCRQVLTVSDLPVAVFAFSMATTTRGAPIPEKSALVGNPQFQEILKDSSSLTHKILQSIPGAHRSCVNVEVRGSTLSGDLILLRHNQIWRISSRHFLNEYYYCLWFQTILGVL